MVEQLIQASGAPAPVRPDTIDALYALYDEVLWAVADSTRRILGGGRMEYRTEDGTRWIVGLNVGATAAEVWSRAEPGGAFAAVLDFAGEQRLPLPPAWTDIVRDDLAGLPRVS